MTSCSRCGGALEVGDLRCPLCGLRVAQALAAEAGSALVRAKVVRCDACGASLAYSAEAKAPQCAFCASVMHVEFTADPQEQAEFFLAFRVDADAARAALLRFLGEKRFFQPSDLTRLATVQPPQPLWWPAWVFSAGALVSWTADSNAGSRRSDWAPHAGQVDLAFEDILVSASRGLSEEECARLASHYSLEGAGATPQGPADAQVERFDVTRSGARRQILQVVQAQARERVRREHIPGSRFRHVHVAVILSRLETRRYALPAHVLAYRYRDKVYRVVVHGQDASVVMGQTPVSVGKVLLALLGVIFALGVLFLLMR
ncbi:MAG: zinc ribbon domain-containing protein [Cystobacter sp.]